MTRTVIALATTFAVTSFLLSACGGFGSGTGGCRVTADNPHRSRNTPSDIVGKGRIVCDVAVAEVFLYVQVERQDDGEWATLVRGADPAVGAVPVGQQVTRQAASQCQPGLFRTAARGEGVLGGARSASVTWTYSRVVTDPCGN